MYHDATDPWERGRDEDTSRAGDSSYYSLGSHNMKDSDYSTYMYIDPQPPEKVRQCHVMRELVSTLYRKMYGKVYKSTLRVRSRVMEDVYIIQ